MKNTNRTYKPSLTTVISKEEKMKTANTITSTSSTKSLYIITMIAAMLFTLGLIITPGSIEARAPFRFFQTTDGIVERLTERLELTEEQVEAITPVIENKVNIMNEIREKAATDRQAARAEMHKLMLDTEANLSEILTEEQISEYLEYRQERNSVASRGKARGGRAGKNFNRTPEQAIDRLTDMLGLTEEQAEDIEPIIADSFDKKQEIFEKYAEARQKDRLEMRSEMHAVGDETHDKLSTILTEEQMEQLLTISEEKRARKGKGMYKPAGYEF